MIRTVRLVSTVAACLGLLTLSSTLAPAAAQTQTKAKTGATQTAATQAAPAGQPKTAKSKAPATKTKAATQAQPAAKDAGSAAKPTLVASYGDWGAYTALTGKAKTCYALAQPSDRAPAALKRDPAYVFISTRPAEGVRNEVSFVMGFDVKGAADPKVQVGTTSFAMVAEGANLWVKNAAQEGQLIDAMKKNQKITVKATSLRGNATTDTYSLAGLVQALDRVQKECP